MEIWQSLRPIGKKIVLGFRRQKYIYQPVPVVDLKPHNEKNNEWEAVGPSPQFVLKNVSRPPPKGWIQMRMNLSFKPALNSRPTLYFDDGNGCEQIDKLELIENKKIKEFVFLPPNVQSLRFLPCGRKCVFSLDSIEMRKASRWEVYLKKFPDFLWRSFHDLSFSDKVKKAVKIWREQGSLFLIKRIMSEVSGNRENPNFAFHEWVNRFDTLSDLDKAGIRRHLKTLPYHPRVSILIPVCKPPDRFLSEALESVCGQLYPQWEIWLCADLKVGPQIEDFLNQIENRDDRLRVVCGGEPGGMTEASNSALEAVSGEWLAFLGRSDKISAHALYSLIHELNEHPEADIIYSDEDKIDECGRRSSPHFKSDWNPDLFYSHNYIGGLLACRTAMIKETGGFRKEFETAGIYDLLLRCLNKTLPEKIRHVPGILYHRRDLDSEVFDTDPMPYVGKAGRASLKAFFEKKGERVHIDSGLAPFMHRVRFSVKEPPPKVDILIPTRNRHLLLSNCINSIREQTEYPDYEIMVIDNQSDDPESIEFLNRLQSENIARVLTFDRPFNFSAINNYAVSKTESPMICLMNNDIEVISPDWLLEMVSHAQRLEIGAVGCKLLYPDHTIQHGGLILGIGGVAGHSHRHFPEFSKGYFGRLQTAQNVSAVTAACLVVRRALYEQLGGFDERLEVALSDVDFCLRSRELGYRNLWTPHAKLIHHESQSRGLDEDSPEKWEQFKKERGFMLERWGETLNEDPYYNPNLSLDFEDFRISSCPKLNQPWLEFK